MSVLAPFLDARHVVVIGASSEPDSFSGRPIGLLQRVGFAGRISVVNPRRATVQGLPSFPTLEAVPGDRPDLAMIVVRADLVGDALAACTARGVQAAVVVADGIPSEAMTAFRTKDLLVIGPNCLGFISRSAGMAGSCSSYAWSTPLAPGGQIALVTQSGGAGNSIVSTLDRRGIAIGHWFSTGSEWGLGCIEIAAALLERPEVEVLGLFIEGLSDADGLVRLSEMAREACKPVIVLKSAGEGAASAAAIGHTGRVLGPRQTSVDALEGLGFRMVDTVRQMCDVLALAALRPGPRCAIVSVSGAIGVLGADLVERTPGISLANLSPQTRAELAGIPQAAHLHTLNPLDFPLAWQEQDLARAIDILRRDSGVDTVFAMVTPMAHREVELVNALTALPDEGAPVVLCGMGLLETRWQTLPKVTGKPWLRSCETLEDALFAVGRLIPTRATPATRDKAEAQAAGGPSVGLADLEPELNACGLICPRSVEVSGRDAALAAFAGMRAPVVLKGSGRRVAHRTEAGLVAMNLALEGALAEAYDRLGAIADRHEETLIVQEQVPAGLELLVAVRRDPELGKVGVVGLGGLLVELFGCRQVMLLSGQSREGLVDQLATGVLAPLVRGYRGLPPIPIKRLAEALTGLAQVLEAQRFAAIECNPVIVGKEGALWCVDCLAEPYSADDIEPKNQIPLGSLLF